MYQAYFTPFRLILLSTFLLVNFSGCSKSSSTCKTCEAQCGSVKTEQSICSTEAETSFRNAHSDCTVQCH